MGVEPASPVLILSAPWDVGIPAGYHLLPAPHFMTQYNFFNFTVLEPIIVSVPAVACNVFVAYFFLCFSVKINF